jgi:hypothetical protein
LSSLGAGSANAGSAIDNDSINAGIMLETSTTTSTSYPAYRLTSCQILRP